MSKCNEAMTHCFPDVEGDYDGVFSTPLDVGVVFDFEAAVAAGAGRQGFSS